MTEKTSSPGTRPPKKDGKTRPRPPKHDEGGHHRPPRPGAEFLDQAPPDLRKEIKALRKHEGKVLEAMKDPKMKDLFLHNPKAFFSALKIPLPPGINRRLKNQPVQHAFLQARGFRLPTGQTITPKVTVRFTSNKREDD
jgi:hypothetical protein